jgi:hypothetical protein
MRRLCLFVFLYISVSGYAQSVDYDTPSFIYSGSQGTWHTKVQLPANYYSVTDSFQSILFFVSPGHACSASYGVPYPLCPNREVAATDGKKNMKIFIKR